MRIGFETTGDACDRRAVGRTAVARADLGDGAAEQPLPGAALGCQARDPASLEDETAGGMPDMCSGEAPVQHREESSAFLSFRVVRPAVGVSG